MLIRPYAPADRAAVLELVTRLSVGKPDWRDQERWQQAFRGWVTAAVDAVGAGTESADADPDDSGQDEDGLAEPGHQAAPREASPQDPTAADRAQALFVAERSDGSVVGFVHVRAAAHFTGEPEAYIGELTVAQSHTRQGVGRALVEQATNWAREHDFQRVALHTAAGSPTALAFYQALGFQPESVYLTAPIDP